METGCFLRSACRPLILSFNTVHKKGPWSSAILTTGFSSTWTKTFTMSSSSPLVKCNGQIFSRFHLFSAFGSSSILNMLDIRSWMCLCHAVIRQRLLGELFATGVSRKDIEDTLSRVPFVSRLLQWTGTPRCPIQKEKKLSVRTLKAKSHSSPQPCRKQQIGRWHDWGLDIDEDPWLRAVHSFRRQHRLHRDCSQGKELANVVWETASNKGICFFRSKNLQ